MCPARFCRIFSRSISLPLVLATAFAQTAASAAPQNQTRADEAVIEVAVVKPHPAAVMHNNFSFSRNRFELEDQPVLKLIAFAYSLTQRQIVGAPGWLSENHYDLSGTTNLTQDATIPQEQQLLRQLLKERFGLQFHLEKRDMSAYALQVVNGQPKLKAAADASVQPLEWSEGHGWEHTENYRSRKPGPTGPSTPPCRDLPRRTLCSVDPGFPAIAFPLPRIYFLRAATG